MKISMWWEETVPEIAIATWVAFQIHGNKDILRLLRDLLVDHPIALFLPFVPRIIYEEEGQNELKNVNLKKSYKIENFEQVLI